MKRLVKVLSVAMLLVLALALVACAPKDTEAAKEKMEKAGYTVVVTTNKEVGENGEVGTITCAKNEGSLGAITGALNGKGLTGTLYDSTKNAKAALEATKDAEGKTSAKQVGKWVVVADDEAYKAFK